MLTATRARSGDVEAVGQRRRRGESAGERRYAMPCAQL
jgi:hypothetical protein